MNDKKEYHRKYYIKNKVKLYEKNKIWKKNNKDKIKKYVKNNRSHYNEYRKQWIIKNREKYDLWRANNKEKIYMRQRVAKYKISYEQYEQMRVSQNNKCAICEKEFKNSKDINIDHNHLTNKVRQLLCMKCNVAIGLFYDDENIIEKALKYTKKWKELI